MANWDNMQLRAKVLLEEALGILKTSAVEAEFLAGKTASVAKLHVEHKKLTLEKHKKIYDLGKLIYEDERILKPDIAVSAKVKNVVKSITRIDNKLKKIEKQISSVSITKKKPKERKKR